MADEILCKLTRPDRTTFGGHLWTPGEWFETSGEGELCGSGWIHLYAHPLVAEWMDPIHAKFGPNAILWRVEVEGERRDDHGLKLGVTRLRIVEPMPRAEFPLLARVRGAIRCCDGPDVPAWIVWRDRWLSGEDRSEAAAAEAAARATARAAEAEAEAEVAAWVAAEVAAWVAAVAAVRAARAAEATMWAGAGVDLIVIAQRAIREEAELAARGVSDAH